MKRIPTLAFGALLMMTGLGLSSCGGVNVEPDHIKALADVVKIITSAK